MKIHPWSMSKPRQPRRQRASWVGPSEQVFIRNRQAENKDFLQPADESPAESQTAAEYVKQHGDGS